MREQDEYPLGFFVCVQLNSALQLLFHWNYYAFAIVCIRVWSYCIRCQTDFATTLLAGLTVILILLVLISAVTACKRREHVFCFDNCNTTNVTQFCNCVVDEVVQANDSVSLESDTIVSEFENQAEMILNNTTEGPCVWCCTLIRIRQYLPQGTKQYWTS